MEKITCTHCGEDNKTNAKYCSNCGYELPKVSPDNTSSASQQIPNKKKTNQKKIVGVIVGIIAFGIFYFIAQQAFFKIPSFDKAMMMMASELNKTCPVMVDADTRLDNTITLPEKKFQYNYTLVRLVKDSINIEGMEEFLTPQILNTIKTSPDLQFFRDHDVILIYNYKDKNSNHVLKLTFTPDQYK